MLAAIWPFRTWAQREGRRSPRSWTRVGFFWCSLWSAACQREPAAPSVEVRMQVSSELKASLTERWMESLQAHRARVAFRKPVHLELWQETVAETPVIYLAVAWPHGWLLEPRHTPLPSPVKLGLALEGGKTSQEQVRRAVARLLQLFWVQIELAQSPWPTAVKFFDTGYPIAVRSMTADWLGRHGKKDPSLAQGCLALLAHALANPRDPELERLESSVACLSKVASQKNVPEILDRMPNGHLRVEMARVELLGELGGSLAQSQLLWVKEQAQETALVRAAQLALERLALPAS